MAQGALREPSAYVTPPRLAAWPARLAFAVSSTGRWTRDAHIGLTESEIARNCSLFAKRVQPEHVVEDVWFFCNAHEGCEPTVSAVQGSLPRPRLGRSDRLQCWWSDVWESPSYPAYWLGREANGEIS